MFRLLQKLFASTTTEQIYLAERLQSAKWLGWDRQAEASAASGQTAPACGDERAQDLLAMPVSGKPA